LYMSVGSGTLGVCITKGVVDCIKEGILETQAPAWPHQYTEEGLPAEFLWPMDFHALLMISPNMVQPKTKKQRN
jgi:hypothetical protein